MTSEVSFCRMATVFPASDEVRKGEGQGARAVKRVGI